MRERRAKENRFLPPPFFAERGEGARERGREGAVVRTMDSGRDGGGKRARQGEEAGGV